MPPYTYVLLLIAERTNHITIKKRRKTHVKNKRQAVLSITSKHGKGHHGRNMINSKYAFGKEEEDVHKLIGNHYGSLIRDAV
jgi:hypothetical protein